MMRFLFILLIAGSAFALQPSGTYTGCISADPAATNRITTTPANGAYGVGVDDYVMLRGVRYYGGYGPGFHVENAGNCFRWMGQTISLDDEEDYAGGTWDVTLYEDFAAQDYDTLWVDSTAILDSVWVTEATDTLYDDCPDDTTVRCAGIIYADTLQTWTDSLKIERGLDYPHFYQVEWFFRFDGGDSMYYDTLIYVTDGDDIFFVNRNPVSVVGETTTGVATIRGNRSAGMDVWTDNGRVISSVDSAELNRFTIPYSFTWSGLAPSAIETLRVWGVTPEGVHSDTTRITRRYINLNSGTFRRR